MNDLYKITGFSTAFPLFAFEIEITQPPSLHFLMEYPLPLHSQCGCPLADRPVPVVDAKLEERLLDVLGGAEVVHRLGAHRARRHSPRLLGGARFRRRNSNLASKCGRLTVVHRNNFEHFILLQSHT